MNTMFAIFLHDFCCKYKQNSYLCSVKIQRVFIFGGLAQLARAFDWQSKGHRFDSDILHEASWLSVRYKKVGINKGSFKRLPFFTGIILVMTPIGSGMFYELFLMKICCVNNTLAVIILIKRVSPVSPMGNTPLFIKRCCSLCFRLWNRHD